MVKKKMIALISALGSIVLSAFTNIPKDLTMIGELHYVIGMSVVMIVVFAMLFILNIALRFTK